VLLGEYGTQEPDGGGGVRKDADHVGAAADLLVELLLRVVALYLALVLGRASRPPITERSPVEDLIPAQVARRFS